MGNHGGGRDAPVTVLGVLLVPAFYVAVETARGVAPAP